MNDIYMMTDMAILTKIGEKLKAARLRQNITQQSLAEISSFDALLRLLRTLGKLDLLQQLVEEEQMSPNEYYHMVQSSKTKQRKRAVGKLNNTKQEESEW